MLDSAGVPVTTVADLEIVGDDGDAVPGAPAHVAAILSGPVLLTRMFGGDPPPSRWQRISWCRTSEHVGITVELTVPGDALDLDWVERWVRDHVVGRIPGGLHDPGGGRVILGDLLDARVLSDGGEPLGHVVDVRLVLETVDDDVAEPDEDRQHSIRTSSRWRGRYAVATPSAAPWSSGC